MRRLAILLPAILLFLVIASPAAAARPIKSSGTVEGASAFSSSCVQQGGNLNCTDVFVDAFSFETEFSDVCVSTFSYTIRANGQFRPGEDQFGCGPANGFAVAGDATSATLGSSQVELFSCDSRSCTSAGTVTVAAEWSAIETPTAYSGKATIRDGGCTYRQSWTGVRASATARFSIGATAYAGDGFIFREEFTVSEQCR